MHATIISRGFENGHHVVIGLLINRSTQKLIKKPPGKIRIDEFDHWKFVYIHHKIRLLFYPENSDWSNHLSALSKQWFTTWQGHVHRIHINWKSSEISFASKHLLRLVTEFSIFTCHRSNCFGWWQFIYCFGGRCCLISTRFKYA